MDNIIFKRVWQDDDFFSVMITCSSPLVTAMTEYYVSETIINELICLIEEFVSGRQTKAKWQSGAFGNGTTPCISLEFVKQDSRGHIRIEAVMEIEDGGNLDMHKCCFYINTELGLLERFGKRLRKINQPDITASAYLNDEIQ